MQYVAIEDKIGVVGKLGELKEYYGLTVKDIVAKAKNCLNKTILFFKTYAPVFAKKTGAFYFTLPVLYL